MNKKIAVKILMGLLIVGAIAFTNYKNYKLEERLYKLENVKQKDYTSKFDEIKAFNENLNKRIEIVEEDVKSTSKSLKTMKNDISGVRKQVNNVLNDIRTLKSFRSDIIRNLKEATNPMSGMNKLIGEAKRNNL